MDKTAQVLYNMPYSYMDADIFKPGIAKPVKLWNGKNTKRIYCIYKYVYMVIALPSYSTPFP